MKFRRLKQFVLVTAALGAVGAAQASDNVYWSVGVVQPGISVGVSNAPPMPVYPAPVYMMPRPVYYAPPVPVYYAPPPGWHHRHHGWKHGRGHGKGHGYWGGRDD